VGRVEIRVVPRASRDELAGFDETGRLKVRLTAPPVEGAANRALIKLFAKRLGVARSAVTVVRGETSRNKLVEIDGLSDDAVRDALQDQE
jgi:uncharacterized protein (TIGR00251 family)